MTVMCFLIFVQNGKIKNLACLIKIFLEQTFSYKTPPSLPAKKNTIQRCLIYFEAYVMIYPKQDRITYGDFLVLKTVLTSILYVF